MLLPGIDSLNHGRGERVTWLVEGGPTLLKISVESESRVRRGGEVLNNYGLKSNGELILGYGFSIADNPEDVVVIKVRGGTRHEIGRREMARGLAAAASEVRAMVEEDGEEWEVLEAMTEALEQRLNDCQRINAMVDNYIKGKFISFRGSDVIIADTIRSAGYHSCDAGCYKIVAPTNRVVQLG